MRSLLVAAWVARMSVAGGAGPDVEEQGQSVRAGEGWEDVRKNFSALRSEISTLEVNYQAAREKRRQDALRQQAEADRLRRGQ